MRKAFDFITTGALVLGISVSFAAYADEVTARDVSTIASQLKRTQIAGSTIVDCDPFGTNASRPACSSLSDAFCNKLYDKEHKGNTSVHDGQIFFGNTREGALSVHSRLNVQALVDREKYLPSDLKAKASPVLARLRELLAKEKDTKAWNKSLSNVLSQWSDVVSEVAKARAEKKHPELKKISESEQTIEQESLYTTESTDLDNEVVKAKYEENPNWKRVERVFKEAQSDIYNQIENLNLSSALKTRLRTKIESVALSLPFDDERISSASSDCNKTEVNAFYSTTYNNFTVCAGLFNSVQSDSALYLVIAHELSHSVDSSTLPDDEFKGSEIGKVVDRFAAAAGPVYSCEDWAKMMQSTLSPNKPINEPSAYPYRRLTECFAGTMKLKDFSDVKVRAIAEMNAAEVINSSTENAAFISLSQPEIEKNGKNVPNPFYMRPDRVYASTHGNVFPTRFNSSVEAQVFVQSLSCQRDTIGDKLIEYEQASDKIKAKMLDRSIQQTKDVIQAIEQNKFAYCGLECGDKNLRGIGLSRDVSEHFADWLAIRAFPRYLSRQRSLEAKRRTAEVGMSFYCDEPTSKTKISWAARAQKKYSFEPHPVDHDRRMSLFTNQVAEAVGCSRDEKVMEGDVECEL